MKKILMLFIFVSMIFANTCKNSLFTYENSEDSPVTLYQFLNGFIVNTCSLNIVYKDDLAKERVKSLVLHRVSVKNYTLNQMLDLLVSKNNLFYELNDGNLEISYIKTKIFNVDYISSIRSGKSTFSASTEESGDTNSVDANYEFDFWKSLAEGIQGVLNTIDTYQAKPAVIDKNSGLITITATKRQLDRVAEYIEKLNHRLHKQIIIDVKIYAVDLASSNTTGINWSKLNFNLGDQSVPIRSQNIIGSQSIFSNAVFNISGLLNFLATQGNVNSISNPKIATLNNQKAIISVGDTINYQELLSASSLDANGNIVPASYKNSNKFVGILLDITPEISNTNDIILRINPKISSFRDEAQLNDPTRTLPPDTTDNKLSTVVRIKDGQTLILGGLIANKSSFNENGVPVLKEIPLVKYLFSSKAKISTRRELVFVVTPHIVDLSKKRTLQDLGF